MGCVIDSTTGATRTGGATQCGQMGPSTPAAHTVAACGRDASARVIGVRRASLGRVNQPCDGGQQCVGVRGLGDVQLVPRLHGPFVVLDPPECRQRDRGEINAAAAGRPNLPDEIEAVAMRHGQVAHYDVRIETRNGRQSRVGRRHVDDASVDRAQQLRQQRPRIVVVSTTSTRQPARLVSAAGDVAAQGGVPPSGRRGNRTLKREPRPSPSLVATMVPPWAETSWWTMASPRPSPPCPRREVASSCRNRSKRAAGTLGRCPGRRRSHRAQAAPPCRHASPGPREHLPKVGSPAVDS